MKAWKLRGLVIAALGITFLAVMTWRRSQDLKSGAHGKAYGVRHLGPASAYPDPSRTPGALNPAITQDNIHETICSSEWSAQDIRPPDSFMRRLKKQQMREWGLPGSLHDYEEDHFVSLALGGSPSDERNLWPERYSPSPGAREKDVVEGYLHREVCSGRMTLREAQTAIMTDWYKVYVEIK